MSTDLRIVTYREIFPVTKVANVEGLAPRTVSVQGQNFSNVEMVRLNGMFSSSVSVVSDTEVLAEVPTAFDTEPIYSAEVFSSQVRPNEATLVDFVVTPNIRTTTGESRMLQHFLMHLMTSPGTDIYDLDRGGGILGLVGAPLNSGQADAVTNKIAVVIEEAVDDFKDIQTENPYLEVTERLANAQILEVYKDTSATTIYITLRVTSMAGTEAKMAMEL